jgi:hypothetical protein
MTRGAERSVLIMGLVLLAGCSSAQRSTGTQGGSGGQEETGGSVGTTGGKSGTGGSPATGGSVGTGGSPATGGAVGTGGSSTGGTAGELDAGATGGAPGDAAPMSGDVGLGILPPGDKHVVVLHGTSTAGDPLRASVMSVLVAMKESHGVIYEEMIDKQTKAAQLADKALVFVAGNSDFCESEQDMAYGDLTIPVIVSKDCDRTTRIFQLGMMHNTPNDQTKIHIVNPMHPLAAGLTGDVTVFPSVSRIVNASMLGPEAVIIATTMPTTTPPSSPTIFYYPKGATMLNGFRAPGKRMGFFWHRPTVGTDGAKKLLHAAVDWMLRQ